MDENKHCLDSQHASPPPSGSPTWRSLPKMKLGQTSEQKAQREQQIRELKRLIYRLETMD